MCVPALERIFAISRLRAPVEDVQGHQIEEDLDLPADGGAAARGKAVALRTAGDQIPVLVDRVDLVPLLGRVAPVLVSLPVP